MTHSRVDFKAQSITLCCQVYFIHRAAVALSQDYLQGNTTGLEPFLIFSGNIDYSLGEEAIVTHEIEQ
jgi:hypothetical protein